MMAMLNFNNEYNYQRLHEIQGYLDGLKSIFFILSSLEITWLYFSAKIWIFGLHENKNAGDCFTPHLDDIDFQIIPKDIES